MRSIRVCSFIVLAALWSAPPATAVTISDNVTDERNEDGDDIACFRIVTLSATYLYDRAGGGFTSILDRDGVDWINYHQGGREQGEFRGIPNTGELHPGYTGGTSWTDDTLDTDLAKVTLHTSRAGFGATWEFYETHAVMTLHTVAGNYWMLYEGTPGGGVEPEDTWWRSDGTHSSCWDDPDWTETDITNTSDAAPGTEWVFFSDSTLDRSLFLVHNDDSLVDDYWQMGGADGMTVFGFGRNGGLLMTEADATLIIGLVESRDFDTVAAVIDAVHTGADSTAPTPPAGLRLY